MMLTSFLIALIAVSCTAIDDAAKYASNNDGVHFAHSSDRPRRLLIAKDDDISDKLRNSIASDSTRHFDIEAESDGDAATGYSNLLLHLDKMTPAVTSKTVLHFRPTRHTVSKDYVKKLAILASSPGEDQDYTIMSVNTASGNIQGLQRGRDGETRQLSVGSSKRSGVNQQTLRVRTVSHSKRNFTCGVGDKDSDHRDHDHDHNLHHDHGHERMIPSFLSSPASQESTQNQHNEKDIRHAPPGPESRHGAQYHFNINLVIAVDADFIRRQGGTKAAVEYINLLVCAANVIYEREIDVHLNVVRIEETNIFRNVDNLRDGLKAMRLHYEGTMDGNGAHLVHAMLGEHIGGGIAFVDTVCDSKWGVGLSSGIRGTIGNLDDDTLQDAFMVAHELGHSLGSAHTFDGYDPPIDSCDGEACPAGLAATNSATVMSYCKFCDGGLDNIALTLGGIWNGSGSKHDINSWNKNPYLTGNVSTDPKRVSHRIWTRLHSKKECMEPALIPPSTSPTPIPTKNPTKAPTIRPTQTPTFNPTTDPTISPTFNPTTDPTISPTFNPTMAPTQYPTTSPSKSPTYFPDLPEDGLIWFQPEQHCMEERGCAAGPGIMFDLSLNEEPFSYGVLVESMQFEHKFVNATADLYTIEGSHLGREQTSDQWRKVATVDVEEANSHTKIELDTPITIFPGEKQGFYLVTPSAENLFLVGMGSLVSSADSNGVSLEGGSVVFDIFGFNATGYYPTLQVGYMMADAPTMNPTTYPPTVSPTLTPTLHPTTSSPTISPSAPPTMQPTTYSPTRSPSDVPTMSPTTSSPTMSPIITYTVGPEHICNNDCLAAPGYMFSVKNRKLANTRDIIISRISFEHIAPKENRHVHLYLTSDFYHDKVRDSKQWQKLASLKVPKKEFHYSEFVLDTPITLAKGAGVSFYVQAEENILLVAKSGDVESSTKNDGRVRLIYGSSIASGSFGAALKGYSWNGEVSYSTIELEPTFQPAALSSHTKNLPTLPPS